MFLLQLSGFNLNDDAQESRVRLYTDFIITGGDDLLQIPSTKPTTTTACTS